ncbi:hypothetical protein ACLB2K_003915 [Fragaria x ananassa]
MRQWGCLLGSFAAMLLLVLFLARDGSYDEMTNPVRRSLRSIIPWQQHGVSLIAENHNRVVLDNGIVKLIFSNPEGNVIGIQYKGLDILEMGNEEDNRGYWDLVWKKNTTDKLQATKFKVITARPDQAEISFLRTYDVSLGNGTNIIPLTVDKRYILQRGASGFYAYGIFERLEGWPGVQDMDQIRMVFKLEQAKFDYMALSDTRQRMMPIAADRGNGEQLAYKEAVLLTDPSNPEFRGEVDDKYQYSIEDKDNKVHGWISTDESVGFWMITPSDEFRTGGPFKQDLTSHVGPTTLSMFVSTHYAGKDLGIKFEEGKAWKKVFGPVFVYLNSAPSSKNSTSILWNNAKQQLLKEVKIWPYNFTQSKDFPSSDQRGSVSGQLQIHDRYINESLLPASSAYVGLAAPGEVGSWQRENKGYQFWNQADEEGRFILKDVRPGNYSLYAWVPGVVGDYKYEGDITIIPGCNIKLDNLTFEPPRNGPTLWEIGIPDRTAAEFYVPDPYPTLLNNLYNHIPSENFRQYGLWARYGERYPHGDLVYTVGVNNYTDHWFYAQVTKNTGDETYVGTTWEVVFELHNVTNPGIYTLQLALASAHNAEVQVRINSQSDKRPLFSTKLIGGDNAIARHGIHGFHVSAGSLEMQKTGRRSLRHWGWLVGTLAAMLILVVYLVGEKKYEKTTPKTSTLLLRKILERYPRTQRQGMNILKMPTSGRNFARPPYPGINMVTNNNGRRIIARTENPRVSMLRSQSQIRLDNGFLQLTVSRPGGDVIGIKYKGSDNLLEHKNLRNNRGYWDVVWNKPGESLHYVDKLQATKFRVIVATADQVEISFIKTYNVSQQHSAHAVPLDVDKRYIMRRGRSGFYAYAIFECREGWPEMKMEQIRMVYKLQHEKFQYMVLSDTRQTFMPKARDRKNGEQLAYPEAVRLTKPSNRAFKGQVDDKYQYSMEDKDNKVHGWISTDNSMGFWMITPSDEFRSAGPMKQGLTSHVGPTTLSMFLSTHYAGKQTGIELKRGEAWKKVFGPVFVYLNSTPRSNNSTSTLWNDATVQMAEEVKRWPYNFTQSEDFPPSDQRGSVSGRLIVHDRYMSKSLLSASSAYVGLAAPGEVGSWQKESKGYQFWTRADKQGHFLIKDVRPGNYSLYGWVPGIVGDYKYEADIEIKPGSKIQLANLTYEPPRNGPTLWEIGIPDRSAAEFYVPDPYPTLMNKLYNNDHSDKFRQYGLWKRYEELYPDHDLIYSIGVNDYRHDWFYAHVTRSTGKERYVGTTWQIRFKLNSVMSQGNYTLQLALASATSSEIQVRFNDPSVKQPHFSTGLIGGDNAIARHGIHGLYWFFSVNVPSSLLQEGTNTIYLTQSRGGAPFRGVMYDYIRLEGPSIRHPDT